jgi:hypothetical protein
MHGLIRYVFTCFHFQATHPLLKFFKGVSAFRSLLMSYRSCIWNPTTKCTKAEELMEFAQHVLKLIARLKLLSSSDYVTNKLKEYQETVGAIDDEHETTPVHKPRSSSSSKTHATSNKRSATAKSPLSYVETPLETRRRLQARQTSLTYLVAKYQKLTQIAQVELDSIRAKLEQDEDE